MTKLALITLLLAELPYEALADWRNCALLLYTAIILRLIHI